ncbi:hypothetical protein [Alicyclobacillus acidoterrestris]|uniref:Uncharacterized protein n=1 Tax=Alicyclobacillus acidoterrestris (strain ATCC 49025 / DSM 3922 / CIP 106132 / NCIMB 13137 / GD3B) TaxID=1356854 RepID=T0BHR8_ALIAG|nr:hypothetical protein [Alicyclobacillus acidoterrestris]EPZ43503.1 hypothetical protein N007_12405 [Alicyclobacillus acidoterrestris ATCC 49025]UNO50184.1 hypothetical protein K1I37_06840 [Alicyclobacillus acidoterrestris]
MLLKGLYWVISILIILALCWFGYKMMMRVDNASRDYLSLLRRIEQEPNNNTLREKVYEAGRRYYRSKITGIDASIERDINDALQGKHKENYDVRAFDN